MAGKNDITGDSLVAKALSETGKVRHEAIFGEKWRKHYGGIDRPVAPDTMVEIETYNHARRIFCAREIDWSLVKWYRVKISP